MLNRLKQMNADEFNAKATAFIKSMNEEKELSKQIMVCVVLAIVFVFLGKVANSNLHSSVTAAMERRDEYKNIQLFLDTYNKDMDAYQKEVTKITGTLLKANELDKSMTLVQKMAEARNVKINSTQRRDTSDKIGAGVQSQDIKMTVSGTYSDILQFISDIENASFFTAINSVAMRSDPKTADKIGVVDANLDYSVFFEKAPDEKKGGDGKK